MAKPHKTRHSQETKYAEKPSKWRLRKATHKKKVNTHTLGNC